MSASDFEFKFRFWFFGFIFWISFASYSVDHVNVVQAVVEWAVHARGATSQDWQYHLAFAVASLFCIAAAAIRTWGTAYLNASVMTDMRLHTNRLVADGPYRHVRNPLYFGNILLAIGFGMMASRLGFALMVLGMIVFDYRLILREEAGILASQGESYRAYCAAVPRLLPALRPKLPAAGAAPKWSDGFLGEAFMWALAASIVAFAITLNRMIFWVVLASAFVVYGVCYAFIARAKQKDAAGQQPSSAGVPPQTEEQSKLSR